MAAAATPFFSIVLPTYGVERFIANALDCLQAQTFSDFEVVVVDDATPDESAAIARAFAEQDARIRVISHTVNKGLSQARNTGLEAAKGTYVWFPDPDDGYVPTALEKIHDAIVDCDHAPDLVLFGHCDQIIDPNETLVSVRSFEPPAQGMQATTQFRKSALYLERHTILGYAWNKAYRREAIGDLRFLDDRPLVEDALFNMAFFRNVETAAFVTDTLYHYKKRQKGNLTAKHVPEYYAMHKLRVQTMRNLLDEWGLLDEEAKGTLSGIYTRYILSALERNHDPRSQMTRKNRLTWCKEVAADPLFAELMDASATSDIDKAIALSRKALKTRNALVWDAAGAALHAAKAKSEGAAWSSATSNR